jgi:CBS domain-containing protein
MKVRAVTTEGVVTSAADETLLEAAETMAEYEVGCLPVMRGDDLIGIFTERDLVKAIADGARPDEATIGQYMTDTPATVPIEAELKDAAGLMLAAGVRHLPVVDGEAVVGMVSIRDVVVEQVLAPSEA